MRTLVTVSLVLCLVTPVLADSLPQAPQSSDVAKLAWQFKVDDAKAGEKRGRLLTYIGAGVAGGGLILGVSGGSNCRSASGISFSCGGNDSQKAGGIILLLGGGGLAALGFMKWRSNTHALESLASEGKLKGYVSVLPTNGGALASVALSF